MTIMQDDRFARCVARAESSKTVRNGERKVPAVQANAAPIGGALSSPVSSAFPIRPKIPPAKYLRPNAATRQQVKRTRRGRRRGHNWPATVFRIPPLFESPYFPAQNDFPEFQPSFETDVVFLDGLSPVPGFSAPYESPANIPRNPNHALKLSWANDPLPALGKLDISLDLQEKFASLQPGQHIPRDWPAEMRSLCKKWRRVMAERKYNQSGPGKMRRVRYALKIRRGGGLKNQDDSSRSPDSQRSPVSPDGSP